VENLLWKRLWTCRETGYRRNESSFPVIISMQEELYRRLSAGNTCYDLVQYLLSSLLLFRNVKGKIYRTIMLPIVSCGCGMWSVTFREEPNMKLVKNSVLRKIFRPKREKVSGDWRIICIAE
jgi:hypothetical protein